MIIFKGLEMNGHSVEARENDLIVDGKIVPNEITINGKPVSTRDDYDEFS